MLIYFNIGAYTFLDCREWNIKATDIFQWQFLLQNSDKFVGSHPEAWDICFKLRDETSNDK